jgi:hypothetical protein
MHRRKQLIPFAIGALAMLTAVVALGPLVRPAPAGTEGATLIRRAYKEFTVPPGDVRLEKATCPDRHVPISGGYSAEANVVFVTTSAPLKTGWLVEAIVPDPRALPNIKLIGPARIRIVAWCVPVGREVVASVAP